MGLTSVVNHNTSIRIPTLPSSLNKHLFLTHPPSNLILPRVPLRRCFLTLARRRSTSGRPASAKKKKARSSGGSKKDEDVEEDAFVALFKQLEEDLKKDGEFVDDGEDDISEEDLVLLERELGEALAVDEDLAELLSMHTDDAVEVEAGAEEVEGEVEEDVGEDDGSDYDEEEAEEQEPIKLRGWQVRRLAQALKVGRRKTSIKKLAAELCLDRAIVLELLREPPPNLLLMCAALPDKQESTSTISKSEVIESPPSEGTVESAEPDVEPDVDIDEEPEPKIDTPIHVLQGSWSSQKRLKKVQVETLENVYRRTKRPTNAMISSIVHVTNLPRRRVVKWFEDKRTADGVPEQQAPYRRSAPDTVFAK